MGLRPRVKRQADEIILLSNGKQLSINPAPLDDRYNPDRPPKPSLLTVSRIIHAILGKIGGNITS